MQDEINDALKAARDEPLSHSDGTQWTVTTWSTSYSDGGGRVDWEIGVQEVADQRIDSVELLGINADVRWFQVFVSSDPDVDPTTVTLELLLNEEQHRTISDLRWQQATSFEAKYFPVNMRGAAETAFSARLGQVVWQRTDDGFLNHFVLVSERGDGPKFMKGLSIAQAWEPRLQRTTEIAARNERALDVLVKVLHESGALSSDAMKEVRRVMESGISTAQWDEIRRVDDIENYR
jgi:hypothetical protein